MRELHFKIENVADTGQFDFADKFGGKTVSVRFPFKHIQYDNSQIRQGWKIHLSPTLDILEPVLNKVDEVCRKNKTSYKFAYSFDAFFALTSKTTPASQFGKIITIYPRSDEDFSSITEELFISLSRYTGMNIPSDRDYKKSTMIHYRYGGIMPLMKITNENDFSDYIIDGTGKLIPDDREPWYQVPNGITFHSKEGDHLNKLSPTFTGVDYKTNIKLSSIIRRVASGNVFRGTANGLPVVVKEARYGALPTQDSPRGFGIKLKKNEKAILQNELLSKTLNFPKYVDSFYSGRNYFLVESFEDGVTLKDWSYTFSIAHPGPATNVHFSEAKRLTKILKEIIRVINTLHETGYTMSDISPDNFLITEDDKVVLIDAESIHKVNSKKVEIQTPLFNTGVKQSWSAFRKDFYRLGMAMFWVLTRKNAHDRAELNEISADLRYFVNKFPFLSEVSQTILRLLTVTSDDAVFIYTTGEEEELVLRRTSGVHSTKHQNDLSSRLLNINNALISRMNDLVKECDYSRLSFTPYPGYEHSLAYGVAGMIAAISIRRQLTKREFDYWTNEISKRYDLANKQGRISPGLLFGKAGLAVALAKVGVSFGGNLPLLDLLADLNDHHFMAQLPNSLANGTAGIAGALLTISHLPGYFSMDLPLKALYKQLEKVQAGDEIGLEYGITGVALIVHLLRLYDPLARLTISASQEERLSQYVTNAIKKNTSNGIFLGFPEKDGIKMIYPDLSTGGAGAVLFKVLQGNASTNWETLLSVYDIPSMIDYGLLGGVSGILLPLVLGLKRQVFVKKRDREHALRLIRYWLEYLLDHYVQEPGGQGFYADQGVGIKDDVASGNVGIQFVLEQILSCVRERTIVL